MVRIHQLYTALKIIHAVSYNQIADKLPGYAKTMWI